MKDDAAKQETKHKKQKKNQPVDKKAKVQCAHETKTANQQQQQEDESESSVVPLQEQEEEQQLGVIEKWILHCAVLGDSPLALGTSFLIVVLCIGLSYWIDTNTATNADHHHHHRSIHSSLNGTKQNYNKMTGSVVDVNGDLYDRLGPVPKIDPPHIFQIQREQQQQQNLQTEERTNPVSYSHSILTDDMRRAFEKDGVIAIRGSIDDSLLEQLDLEAQALIKEEQQQQQQTTSGMKKKTTEAPGRQFYLVKHGTIFGEPLTLMDDEQDNSMSNSNNENDGDSDKMNIKSETDSNKRELQSTTTNSFFALAAHSEIPRIAADLLLAEMKKQQLLDEKDYTKNTVRILRDIFLAKDTEQYICGWHVDDLGFWPATPESPGVNAWVALDDMPLDEVGGGFALAVGSHLVDWRQEAQYVTGASTYFPPEGYHNASDSIQRRPGSGTCNIKQAAPHLHQRMEETKRIYDVRRGDVIFHTRWLFHRTVPFNANSSTTTTNADSHDDDDPLLFRRLSIRYGPGSAIIPPGYGLEWSVLWNESNGGRTADEVSWNDGPWYPQVWPIVSRRELSQLSNLIDTKIPIAKHKQLARQKELKPLYRKVAKKNHQAAL